MATKARTKPGCSQARSFIPGPGVSQVDFRGPNIGAIFLSFSQVMSREVDPKGSIRDMYRQPVGIPASLVVTIFCYISVLALILDFE